MSFHTYLPFLLSLILFAGSNKGLAQVFPYQLEKPDKFIIISDSLREISGLSMAANGKDLLAVQDEIGTVFILDSKNFQIKRKIDFIPEGDFEGITAFGDTIFAVKSNGNLFRIIPDSFGAIPKVERFKTGLSRAWDVEGLETDLSGQQLLLACKASPEGMPPDEKRIFAVSLRDFSLQQTPVLRLRLQEMAADQSLFQPTAQAEKILDFLTRPDREGTLPFSPSGIAIQPETGNYYILSAQGRLLAIYAASGKLLRLQRLDKDLFEQPEGICFDKRGTLYISSEGKTGKPVIATFRPKKSR
jgi:uncharacterized protein YjiK